MLANLKVLLQLSTVQQEYHCRQNHSQPCTNCISTIQAAQIILDRSIPLSVVFKQLFPAITYITANAKRHLLQMPALAFQIKGQKGQSDLYLMDERLALFLLKISRVVKEHRITKELKQLLTLTQNDRERELDMLSLRHLGSVLLKHRVGLVQRT